MHSLRVDLIVSHCCVFGFDFVDGVYKCCLRCSLSICRVDCYLRAVTQQSHLKSSITLALSYRYMLLTHDVKVVSVRP